MRKDQPKLIKHLDNLTNYISLLEQSIDEQQVEIDYLKEENKDLEQDLLVQRIEYNRGWEGKEQLTC